MNEQPYLVTLDDDPSVCQIIERATKIKNIGFTDPRSLMEKAPEMKPKAAFIDIGLGADINGLAVIPELRQVWPFCPIIVVTASPIESTIIKALNSGADDFIRKPIIVDELGARLKLRMADSAQKEAKEVITFGDITVDSAHRTVEGPLGKRFASPIEVTLLSCLAHTEGSIVEKDALKLRCWGQIKVTDNALHRKLHAVRQLLKDISPNVAIETKYGVGFCLKYVEPLTSQEAS